MPVSQCFHPPLRKSHHTTPKRRRSPRTRTPRARSPDLVPLPASGPFDPGLIPSEGPLRPPNCPPQHAALGGEGTVPTSSPLSPCRASRSAVGIFLCLCFVHRLRPPGFSLIVPQGPLPLPKDNQLLRAPVPFRGALVRQLVVRVLLLTVALNRQCLHTLLAGCPHAELTEKSVCARNRQRMWLPPLYATHTEDTARGLECF